MTNNNKNLILHNICELYSNKKDIAVAFVWLHYKLNEEVSDVKTINQYFEQSNLPKYNITYLKRDLAKSKAVISTGKGSYKPSRDSIIKFDNEFSELFYKSEDVISCDSIIPESLYKDTRGYIISLSSQINASYENNIFDGCAVLMRRLLEILLIHTYETTKNITLIQDNDGYRNLSYIINYTLSNKPFTLSKEVQALLDSFRELGNLSAHKIQYNAKRQYIDDVKNTYRLAIEELLYLSQIKK